MKILLSGGTGFIGRSLVERLLEKKHEVTLLTRRPEALQSSFPSTVKLKAWDGSTLGDWVQEVELCDAIINLTGESIANKRWTSLQKRKIVQSRVHSTRILADAMQAAHNKPSVFINASAVGYYGSVPEGDVTEAHPCGTGFLAETCVEWEKEASRANTLGARVVLTRFGVVLAKGGGALSKILPPFQMFMGGPLGSGQQWFPWVHRDDVTKAILFCCENKNMQGPVNVTAPDSVTMKEFCRTLGKVMHRPSIAAVPAFMLKLMLGEMADMLLEGQKVIPKKLQEAGYKFQYPKLEQALSQIVRS